MASGDLSDRDGLVEQLRALKKPTITGSDIQECLGIRDARYVNLLAHRMINEGRLTRVAQGLYALSDTPVNRLRHAFHWQIHGEFQISHRSAMAVHGLPLPLPHEELFVTVTREHRARSIDGRLRARYLERPRWELEDAVELDFPELGLVPVASPEVTFLEGVESPGLCGGILEVCRFVGVRAGKWDGEKLLAGARRKGRAVGLRVGMLLDWAKDPAAAAVQPLLPPPRLSAVRLDSLGPKRGKSDRHWAVKVNVPREQVLEALAYRAPAGS